MTALKKIIQEKIKQNGPMSVHDFMALALGHPEHGYYMKQDPFGAKGDFTTAPEISQLFGEIIGIWCLQQWVRLENPSPVHLIEGGPGRGTLMADILRGTAVMEEFQYASEIHLIETSPVLRSIQKQKLGDHITWHADLSTLLPAPMIFVANELLDALPIHQYIKKNGEWMERVIDESFEFTTQPVTNPPIPDHLMNIDEDSIYEHCPLAHMMLRQIAAHIKTHGGVALFIDYGHDQDAVGDTFQAIKNHKYTGIFDDIGDADLTAHVNFASLSETVKAEGLQTAVMTQRDFLIQNGIEIRTQQLMEIANDEQKTQLQSAITRLIDNDKMGRLFKAMIVY